MFEGLLDYLKANLPQKIIASGYNSYEIFGKEVENCISDTIEEYFITQKISYISKRAKNKNDFPDLKIEINGIKYAFEHKSGAYNIKGKICSSPNNDMGTINAYSQKIHQYNDNMYCTFIKYIVLPDDTIQIENIYFDKIYTFIGRGTGFYGQLKYREKDGNLRPKTWNEIDNNIIYFPTLDEFKCALYETNKFRNEKIVFKYLDKLDEDSIRKVKKYIDK